MLNNLPSDGPDGKPASEICPSDDDTPLDFNKKVWLNLWLLPDSGYEPAIDALLAELGVTGHQRVLRHVAAFLLANCTMAVRSHPGRPIAYFRGYHRWDLSRFNPSKVTRKIIDVVDAMVAAGLLAHWCGYRYKGGESKASRMMPTARFARDYYNRFDLGSLPVAYHPEFPFVRVREKDYAFYPAPPSADVDAMVAILVAYNKLMMYADIRMPIENSAVPYVSGVTPAYRSFRNKKLTKGGRLFGPWWLNQPKVLRAHITINSEPTIELDYKAQHAYMIYGLKGPHYDEIHQDGDPYKLLNSRTGAEYERDLIKLMFLILFNAKSELSAWQALRDELLPDFEDKSVDGRKKVALYNQVRTKADFELVLADFRQKHQHINDQICAGVGLDLQFLDSQIAMYVIDEMTKLSIPVLSYHDSFRCAVQHKETLRQLMKKVYKATGIANCLPPIK